MKRHERQPRKLAPLRIPIGWRIDWNTFTEVEPPFEDYDARSWEFNEDMLQLVNERQRVIVDLGWRPEFKKSGAYCLEAARLSDDPEEMAANWYSPLQTLRTRSYTKVVKAIEQWLAWYGDGNTGPPPRVR